MQAARSDRDRFSYQDYLSWDDRQRWELIEGTAWAMSPAPSPDHQRISAALFRQIDDFVNGSACEAFYAPIDVRLAEVGESEEDASSVVQPDLVVVCDGTKIDDRGIVGAPDWIIEILSPSTASRDQGAKRDLYERHGVTEYWLVHPTDRVVFVYRLEESGRYGPPQVLDTEGTLACGALTGLAIDWEPIFSRL